MGVLSSSLGMLEMDMVEADVSRVVADLRNGRSLIMIGLVGFDCRF